MRDLLFDLIDAFGDRDLSRASVLLGEIAAATGPHFRYEEESLYPNLVDVFGADYVDKLLGDHDQAVRTARRLVELAGQPQLSDAEVDEAVAGARSILPHVSDCDGLSIMVERFPGGDGGRDPGDPGAGTGRRRRPAQLGQHDPEPPGLTNLAAPTPAVRPGRPAVVVKPRRREQTYARRVADVGAGAGAPRDRRPDRHVHGPARIPGPTVAGGRDRHLASPHLSRPKMVVMPRARNRSRAASFGGGHSAVPPSPGGRCPAVA